MSITRVHKVRLTQRVFAGGQHGASRVTLRREINKQNGGMWGNYMPDARRELSAILEAIVVVVVRCALAALDHQRRITQHGFFRLLSHATYC